MKSNSTITQYTLKQASQDAFSSWLTLCKIMIPITIAVKTLQHWQLLEPIATALAPIMRCIGVPADFGIVWVMALFVNIYAAIAAFSVVVSDGAVSITIAEASVLGATILYAHGLLVEGAIVKEAGLNFRTSISLRIGAALLYGLFLSSSYHYLGLFQKEASPVLVSARAETASGLVMLFSEAKTLLSLLLVLIALYGFIWLLRKIGAIDIIERATMPLLKLAGVETSASLLVVVGLTLGIAFGGGLLFAEVRAGRVSKQAAKRAMILLCLCHSIIEDTILVLLLGGEIWGLLIIRLLFSLLLIKVILQSEKLFSSSKNLTTAVLEHKER